MEYIIDSNTAKLIDTITINEYGMPGLSLMEQAGAKLTEVIEELCEDKNRQIIVLSGSGNNGGDAVCAARNLLANGFENVIVFVFSKVSTDNQYGIKLSESLEVEFGTYVRFDGIYNIVDIANIGNSSLNNSKNSNLNKNSVNDINNILYGIDKNCIIIDGLFGIGLNKEISNGYKELIDYVNEYRNNNKDCKIVSVDIASGICGDNGKVLGTAIKADMTVTFNYKKYGHIMYPGRDYTGKLIVKNISFIPNPFEKINIESEYSVSLDRNAYDFELNTNKQKNSNSCLNRNDNNSSFIKPSDNNNSINKISDSNTSINKKNLKNNCLCDLSLPVRVSDSNKGTYGKLLCVTGSDGMPGAAILSAKAAYYMGCGLVALNSPKLVLNILAEKLPEAVFVDETSNVDNNKYSASIVGCGISNSEYGRNKLNIFENNKWNGKIVIDADAINIIADEMNDKNIINTKDRIEYLNNKFGNNKIFTPHKKELSGLLNISMSDLENLKAISELLYKTCDSVIVLKDASTFVVTKGRSYINQSGNSGMSTAGSGDVLTGIISSLLAQGKEAFEAAALGVYIHGCAGDIAAEKNGSRSLTASDICENIYKVIK